MAGDGAITGGAGDVEALAAEVLRDGVGAGLAEGLVGLELALGGLGGVGVALDLEARALAEALDLAVDGLLALGGQGVGAGGEEVDAEVEAAADGGIAGVLPGVLALATGVVDGVRGGLGGGLEGGDLGVQGVDVALDARDAGVELALLLAEGAVLLGEGGLGLGGPAGAQESRETDDGDTTHPTRQPDASHRFPPWGGYEGSRRRRGSIADLPNRRAAECIDRRGAFPAVHTVS